MKFSSKATKKKQAFLIVLIIFALLGSCIVGYLFIVDSQKEKNYIVGDLQPNSSTNTNDSVQKVLVASKDLSAGDVASYDAFKFIEIDTSQQMIPLDAIQDLEELNDKRLKIGMTENEMLQSSKLISKNSWYEEGDRLVEINFVEGAIPTIIPREQIIGSLVDIKLFKKGAEDKIVIPKVAVIAGDGNKLGFYLNHKEIDSLKEAATEPDGLYLAIYIDESQQASSITYHPSYSN